MRHLIVTWSTKLIAMIAKPVTSNKKATKNENQGTS